MRCNVFFSKPCRSYHINLVVRQKCPRRCQVSSAKVPSFLRRHVDFRRWSHTNRPFFRTVCSEAKCKRYNSCLSKSCIQPSYSRSSTMLRMPKFKFDFCGSTVRCFIIDGTKLWHIKFSSFSTTPCSVTIIFIISANYLNSTRQIQFMSCGELSYCLFSCLSYLLCSLLLLISLKVYKWDR